MYRGARGSMLARGVAIMAVTFVLLLAAAAPSEAQATRTRTCARDAPRDLQGFCKKPRPRPRPRPPAPTPTPEPAPAPEAAKPIPEPPEEETRAAIPPVDEPTEDVPASAAMVRALAHYDEAEYYEASIELEKIVHGATSDSTTTRQRAELLLAATLSKLGYHIPALTRFDQIAAAGDAHPYSGAVGPWLAAVLQQVPTADATRTLRTYDLEQLLDTLELPGAQDEIYFWMGRAFAGEGERAKAVQLLERVSSTSPRSSLALLERAKLHVLMGDGAQAVAMFVSAARDPETATRAVRVAIGWIRRMNQPSTLYQLLEGLGTAVENSEPAAGLVALEMSRLAVEQRPGFPGLAEIPAQAFHAVALGAYCTSGATADLFASSREARRAASGIIADALGHEDPTELFAYVSRQVEGDDDAAPGLLLIRLALDLDDLGDALVWLEEIDRELEALERAHVAWLTTQPARDVLSELTELQLVAEGHAGRWLRQHLGELGDALRAIDDVAVRADGKQLAVGPGLTHGAGVNATRASCAAVPAPLTAAAVPASQGRGCAGCDGGAGASSAAGLGVALTALLVARRRRRRSGM
jgi:tetratricopeptide (TPR) repeat protein